MEEIKYKKEAVSYLNKLMIEKEKEINKKAKEIAESHSRSLIIEEDMVAALNEILKNRKSFYVPTKCKGWLGKVFGHNFKNSGDNKFVKQVPHYSMQLTGFGMSEKYWDGTYENVYDFTYVCSQCVRCGFTVKPN